MRQLSSSCSSILILRHISTSPAPNAHVVAIVFHGRVLDLQIVLSYQRVDTLDAVVNVHTEVDGITHHLLHFLLLLGDAEVALDGGGSYEGLEVAVVAKGFVHHDKELVCVFVFRILHNIIRLNGRAHLAIHNLINRKVATKWIVLVHALLEVVINNFDSLLVGQCVHVLLNPSNSINMAH